MGIKLLMGGSPCTHWSIAQTKDRETEPSGIGWELFENFAIAIEKYKPDYFIYENNKSASPAIKAEITKRLGVELTLINSALVSPQNRWRIYVVGKRNPDGTYSHVDVAQPEDRGILLRDVLESGMCWNEKSYCLTATEHKGSSLQHSLQKHVRTQIAEPVRIGTIESTAKNADFDSQPYRVYSPDGKSVTLCGNGGGVGAKTGLYAAPVRVGDMPTKGGKITGSQNARIYSQDAKSPTLTARPNGGGVDGPLYAIQADVAIYQIPREYNKGGIKHGKSPTLTANGDWAHNNFAIVSADGKTYPIYEVRNGLITIKDKQYPIKLADGYYIIRKLTVTECKRLQTVPDSYVFPVSDTQATRCWETAGRWT